MDPMSLLVYVGIIVILVVVLWFLFTQIALPEPIGKIVMIVIVIFVAVVAIGLLLQLGGHGGGFKLR